MGLNFDYIPDQTPISEDEKEALRIPSITTLKELNEFEQLNIEKAVEWTMRRSFKKEMIFSEHFTRLLHKKMFEEVWDWAGRFRTTNKNIGVDKFHISTELKKLLKDALYWIEHGVYSADEITLRFKRRLVFIHCFPNGNGRHSRLMADTIITHVFKKPAFSWSNNTLYDKSTLRKHYIDALREADHGNFQPLIEFARS